jgi:hypothetical protein
VTWTSRKIGLLPDISGVRAASVIFP